MERLLIMFQDDVSQFLVAHVLGFFRLRPWLGLGSWDLCAHGVGEPVIPIPILILLALLHL
jgi:hypothetical protein